MDFQVRVSRDREMLARDVSILKLDFIRRRMSGEVIFNSFLSAYLITVIIATLLCNSVILMAVYRLRDHSYHVTLSTMAVLSMIAASLLLPSTMVTVAERSFTSSQDFYFCQFLGAFSSFLHRASTFSLCLAHVDRYVLIRRPMIYTASHRLLFSLTCTIAASILALLFALMPFATAQSRTGVYVQPRNSPFCVFYPLNHSGRTLLLFDVIFSYITIWVIMTYAMIGMLAIACFASAGTSRTAPMPSNRLVLSKSFKLNQVTEAWIEKPRRIPTARPESEIMGNTSSTNTDVVSRVDQEPKVTLGGKHQGPNNTGLRTARKKNPMFCDVEDANYGSARASNLVLNDEVTVHENGTAQWRSSAVAAVSATNFQLFVERKLTLEDAEEMGVPKISLSSTLTEQDGMDSRRSVRRKKDNIQPQTQKIKSKKCPRRLNAKAFVTLTITQCLFTLLVLPVATSQFILATSQGNLEAFDNFWLEILISISFSFTYVAFPVMTALADKEIKRTIVKLLKRICDDLDVGDDVIGSNNFANERI